MKLRIGPHSYELCLTNEKLFFNRHEVDCFCCHDQRRILTVGPICPLKFNQLLLSMLLRIRQRTVQPQTVAAVAPPAASTGHWHNSAAYPFATSLRNRHQQQFQIPAHETLPPLSPAAWALLEQLKQQLNVIHPSQINHLLQDALAGLKHVTHADQCFYLPGPAHTIKAWSTATHKTHDPMTSNQILRSRLHDYALVEINQPPASDDPLLATLRARQTQTFLAIAVCSGCGIIGHIVLEMLDHAQPFRGEDLHLIHLIAQCIAALSVDELVPRLMPPV